MTKLDYANPTLRREIGLFGAVMLGLGSILGTGVFVSLAHATELAGPWVLLAIVLAGLLAYCNAMSSAQLAAAYPVSGGTYEYGYRVLNPTLGFTAGWMFLLAKSASAATAALGAWYALDALWIRQWLWSMSISRDVTFVIVDEAAPLIMPVIFLGLLVIVSLTGLRRTTSLNTVLVLVTLIGLITFVGNHFLQAWSLWHLDPSGIRAHYMHKGISVDGVIATLHAAALSFVAFTGYGRLATLGEEVRRPVSTIPRAICITLAASVVLYLAVAFVLGGRLLWPWPEIDPTKATLSIISRAMGSKPAVALLISLAAVTAMLGVLLNLILGLSRVWLAMGRRGDMPRVLARVNEKTSTPVPATILTGTLIALLILVGDVRTTWSFSAFTVLIYYAITNWAALKLAPEFRRYPRALSWIGLVACLSLAWFVEVKVWIAGTILIVVGLIWHRIRSRWRGQTDGLVAPS